MEKIELLKEEDLEIILSRDIKKILFIGGTDTGKTTLIKDIANFLYEKEDVYIFDCDIGQSHVGPPATIGYAKVENKIENFYLNPEKFYFVGSITPSSAIIEFITGIIKIDRYLNEKRGKILIDTTGYIKDEIALSLKINKIEILRPDFVILLEKENELKRIEFFLNHTDIKYKKIKVENLPVKNIEERANYRKMIFFEYFNNLKIIDLNINEISVKILNFKISDFLNTDLKGRICSLRNEIFEDFTLGIINKIENEKIEILVPQKNLNYRKIKGIVISGLIFEP
jgi:polynucleotide 5'-kinase involved in rRNA processing